MRYNYSIPAAVCQMRSYRGGNSEECMRKKANKRDCPCFSPRCSARSYCQTAAIARRGSKPCSRFRTCPAAAAALPEETAAPQGKTYTVTYRVNGAETTELVAEAAACRMRRSLWQARTAPSSPGKTPTAQRWTSAPRRYMPTRCMKPSPARRSGARGRISRRETTGFSTRSINSHAATPPAPCMRCSIRSRPARRF